MAWYVFEGRENTKENLREYIGRAHSFLIRTLRLYSYPKFLHMLNKGTKYSTNFWSSLS